PVYTLAESAVHLCGADGGNIWRIGGDAFRWAGSHGCSEEFRKFVEQNRPGPGRGTLVGRTVLEGRAVQIIDILTDPEYTWPEAAKVEAAARMARRRASLPSTRRRFRMSELRPLLIAVSARRRGQIAPGSRAASRRYCRGHSSRYSRQASPGRRRRAR